MNDRKRIRQRGQLIISIIFMAIVVPAMIAGMRGFESWFVVFMATSLAYTIASVFLFLLTLERKTKH